LAIQIPATGKAFKSEETPFMSIAHELSCDVATAMLAGRDSEQPGSHEGDLTAHEGDLTDVVLEVHSTLRCLTGEARRSQLNRELFPTRRKAAANGGGAASGTH
jgi:hypothetical protein